MESTRRLVLLWAFVASAVAVPVSQREQCARHCSESNRFQFLPGTTYTYDYETSSSTTVQGTTQDKSQLQMTAQVDIEVLSKCELSLRLRGVTLKQSDPQSPEYLNPARGGREFSRALEGHILRFAFDDGRVDSLCPSAQAPTWVTNVQRGVLSAFQTSMKDLEGNERLIETDVSGKCWAEYQSLGRSWRGTLTIRKLKDLNSCTDRQNVDTSLQASPYIQGSNTVRTLPLVTGSQECEQSIGSGILQSSSCTEKHVFRPFSREGGGATTTVTQRLIYATFSKRSFTGNDYRPTREGLLFDHGRKDTKEDQPEIEAETALKHLCEATRLDVGISVPSKFAAFVYKLRKLDLQALGAFYRRADAICPDNSKAKKLFMDAVPVMATPSSVQFMANMISQEEVPKSEADFWFTSLSFVSDVTVDMIASLTPLLDGRHEQAYLGVSSLINTFCKSTDCSNVPEVRDAAYKLADNLGENCYNPDTRKILLTLKSLGNIGFVYGKENVLERCYKNPQLKLEVRLSAIQAFRRISCDISREDLLKTYTNYNEDNEIRIAAYLAIMNCLTTETLQTVKETLEKEQVNQVGSFVWTHLQALAKSRHPERQDIRDILSSIRLLTKYQSDIRKFSSAHEASAYIEALDSGVHLDTHVVFPTHSYLPHSATLNLTVDIFGHSCNLLQLDGRLEGLESSMERLFGPGGYFPQKKLAKLLRERRSISNNKIDEMDKEFDAKSRFEEKPYGSMDMKIFGNSLWFGQFEEGNDGTTGIDFMNLITELAEEHEKEFSRSFMFLDTTYTIPMSSGLPLRLALNGTASVALKIGGKFNIRSFQHVDILGHIEPSGSVEIAGLLTVDAGPSARTGLRIAATLHSSTLLDGKVEVRNGEVVKAQLNVPRERIDIVDIQSKLYLVHGLEEREQPGLKEESYHQSSCTGDAVKKVLGVELCSEVRLPGGKRYTPMYPMNGPATFSVYLRKTDPSLTSYTFDAKWEKKMVNGLYVRHGIVSLNTPQSSVDRDVTMEFQLSQPDRTLSFKAKTPFKKFGLNAKLVNEDMLKKLDLSIIVDDQEQLSVQSELRSVRERGGLSLVPTLEVTARNRKLANIAGSFYLKHGHKYSGQLSVQDLTVKPILLKGNLDIKDSNRYDGEISLSSYALDSTVKMYFQMGDTTSTKVSIDYRLLEGRLYKINMNGKVRDLSANALTKYTGVLNMQMTSFPEWDTAISWETMKTTGHLENTLSIAIGDGTRSRVHTINLQEVVRYKGGPWDRDAAVMLKLSYPEKNMNYAFNLKHENTDKMVKNVIEIQYDVNKQISTLLDLSMDSSKSLSLSGDVKIQYPGREARVTAEVIETNPRDYRTSVAIQWQKGSRLNLVTHYRDRSDGSQLKHEADAEITLSDRSPITFSGSIGAHRGQYAGFGELNLGLDKYRINTDYTAGPGLNHRFEGQILIGSEFYATEASLQSLRDKFTGNVELKFPNRRRIVAKVDFKNSKSLKTGSFETMWDADRDQNKRLGVEAEVRNKGTGYDGKFTMQVERRTIKGLLSCNKEGQFSDGQFRTAHKAELEWSPKDKATIYITTNIVSDDSKHQVNAALEVTTPYRGYEAMVLKVDHVDGNQLWNSEVTATLGRNKKYSLSSEGKYMANYNGVSLESSVRLRSSYPGFELMFLNLTHNCDSSEFSNRIQAQWGQNKKITTEIFRSLQGSGFRGGLKITTPFVAFEDIAADLTHSYTSGNYKTKGEVQWAPNKKINVNLDGRHVVSGRRRMCSVNFIASSPFRGYETISSKLVYNNDGTTLNADTEISWHREKLTLGFTGSGRNSYYNKNMEGKIYFTSTFRGYENLQLATSLQSAIDSYKVNIDTQLPRGMSTSFNSEGKIISLHNIELNAVISGEFRNYIDFQRASIDFVHKLQNSDLRSTLDMVYGRDQVTVLLTGTAKPSYKSLNLEGSLSITTPVKGYEELKINVMHNRKDLDFMSRVQASINRDNMLLVHNMNIKDSLNFETNLHVTSSFPSIGIIKASISQIYNPGQFLHNTNIQSNQNKALTLNVQYQDKSPSKELTIKLSTPFEQLTDLEIAGLYEKTRGEYKPKLAIQWNGNMKMAIESNLRNYRMQQVDAKLLFTSNFHRHRIYQLSGKYDMTASKKTAELSFLWDQKQNKIVSLTGSVLYGRQLSEIDLTLSTPFQTFERVSLVGKCENKPYEKSVSLVYEQGRKKVVLDGRATLDSNGAEYQMGFKSPYEYAKDLSALVRYKKDGQSFSGDAFAQWDREQRLSLDIEFDQRDTSGKVSLRTPFEKYENMKLEVRTDTSGPRKMVNAVIQWNDDSRIDLRTECEITKNKKGEFIIEFQSPFKNYEKVSLSGHYKKDFLEYEGEIKIKMGPNKVYQGKVMYSDEDQFTATLDTPHSPFKNVELTTSLTNFPGHYEINTKLRWEDKELDLTALYKNKENKIVEAKLKITTPFQSFPVLNVDGMLQNLDYKTIDARLNSVTPFNALRRMEISGQVKLDRGLYDATLNFNTPSKKLTVSGKIRNRGYQPLEVSLNIDAPFTSFRTLELTTKLNYNWLMDNNVEFLFVTDRSNHVLTTSINKNDESFNCELRAKSPLLPAGNAKFNIEADFKDIRNVKTVVSAEVSGELHTATINCRRQRRESDFSVEISSSWLPEKTATLTGNFSERRHNKNLNGKIIFTVPSSVHELTYRYDMESRQVQAGFSVNSDFLPESVMSADIAYINGNNRDLELTISVLTPRSKHALIGSIKNYEGEKFFQLKIECPMLPLQQFSVTGTLKHENFDTMDGILTITSPQKELRIAGNMKRVRWESVEAFFTLNTPYEPLRMLRIDARFNNDRFRNLDCNIQMETSNKRLPSLGFTSKLSRTEGSEDVSMMLHLPVADYRTVQLLGNLHYNAAQTIADSRLTLSLPPKRYSLYGQYILSADSASLNTEFEQDVDKWTAFGHIQQHGDTKGITVTYTTPNKGSYTLGGSYANSDRRRSVEVSYNNPRNQAVNVNVTLDYVSLSNFDAILKTTMPHLSFRNLNARLRHKSDSRRVFLIDTEYTVDNRRSFLNVLHRLNGSHDVSSIRLGSPCKYLQDVEALYTKNNYDEKRKFEVIYNKVKKLKAETSSSTESHTVLLDLPSVPLIMSMKSKLLPDGREIEAKSNYPTRTMSFSSIYQNKPDSLIQKTTFFWDERAKKFLSYDLKITDTSRGQATGKELYARFNLPVRSLELKGKFTKSSRVSSGGIDFYWDAVRNSEKHMTIGFEHQNIGTQDQDSHKVQMTMSHPRLPKDLMLTSILTISSTECHAKSDLQYSRHQEHHLTIEMRASDHSRDRRETHCKGELSVRHPVSSLDFRAATELTNTRNEASAHLTIQNVDRRRLQRVTEIKGKIVKLRNQIDIIMRSDKDQLVLLGRIFNRDNQFTLTLDQKLNDKNGIYSHFKLNRNHRTMNFNITTQGNRGIDVSASFPKDSASLKLVHLNGDQQVTDGLVVIGLERSRILKSRINWRPGMWQELRIATGETLRSLAGTTSKNVNEMTSNLSEEWRSKLFLVNEAMKVQMSAFLRDITNDLSRMSEDLTYSQDSLIAMYDNNEFHMKDIVRGAKKAREAFGEFCETIALISDMMSNVVVEYVTELYYTAYYALEDFVTEMKDLYSKTVSCCRRMARNIVSKIAYACQSVHEAICDTLRRMSTGLRNMVDRACRRAEEWVRHYAPCIIDGYYSVRIAADKIRKGIQEAGMKTREYLTNHPFYMALTVYWDNVVATVKAFQEMDLMSGLQSRIVQLGQRANSVVDKLSNLDILYTVRKNLPVDYLADLSRATLQKSLQLYNTLGIDKMIRALFSVTMDYAKTTVLNSGHELLQEFYQLKSGAKYDFEPQKGLIAFEYTLPAERSSLSDVLDIGMYPEYQKFSQIKDTLVSKYYEDFCIWDIYYKVKNFFSPRYWMPPFTAHAMLAGNQHYVTFDKFSFDFAGECRYLLVRDFMDGNFTVVVNYGRDGQRVVRKSLTVMSESKKLEISNDYKVTLDDVKVELPLQVDHTAVTREESNIRIENDRKGFVVVCNFVLDICTVGMSGFYFGKTGGLFGTYDYEPLLDTMTPERSLASDIETFANSWEVGQASCRRSGNLATVPGNDRRVQEKCNALFAESASHFRACFKQVDPEPYLRMCLRDTPHYRQDSQFVSGLCTSAAAYFTECRIEGVPLKMPTSCVRCETQDDSFMSEGDVVSYAPSAPLHAADVIFVVEEKKCNEENFRMLGKLAHSIDDNFKQKGFRDVRYGVVGFGGSDVHAHPHVHTVDGQMYGGVRALESAFNSLEVGDGPINMLEALRYAAALPFRPGTTKSFVLVKCSTCRAEEVRAEYSEMLRTLLDGDITLHLLMEQKYEMRIANKNSKAKKVIGLDKKFAYTLKDVKDSNLLGDGDLLAQMKIPKDVCVPLALEVNGSTFDSQYLTETRKNTNKKFMDVLARRLVRSAERRSDWAMCCECIATEDGVGKSACQRCVTNEVANMISPDASTTRRDESVHSEAKPKLRRQREKKRGV